MRRQLSYFAIASLLASSGCSQDLGSQATGLQSIEVRLKQCVPAGGGSVPDGGFPDGSTVPMDCTQDLPASAYGSPTSPVTITDVTFDLRALGPDGNPLPQDFDIDVYLSFSGNKVGVLDACGHGDDTTPMATVHVTQGVSTGNHVHLIRAYGKATLWLEERTTHALGASPPIYFPEPTIPDVQAPLDLTAPTATYCSPWNNRHAIINAATLDTRVTPPLQGQLVVTSVFGDAYVITDTGAMYDPKTDTGGFNNLYVYSFGQPPADIHVTNSCTSNAMGSVIQDASGNLSKFVGFMEFNFPLQDVLHVPGCTQMDPTMCQPVMAAVPPPYTLTAADVTNNIKLLKLDGSVVTVTGQICHIDTVTPANKDQWVKYNSFLLDLVGDGSPCGNFGTNPPTPGNSMTTFAIELPGKTFGQFDPMKLGGTQPIEGSQMVTITGMLRNNSGQNEVCKGYGHDAPILCRTSDDCTAAASDPQYPATCQAKLNGTSTSCVEGSCKRGIFNFWNVVPRTPCDVVF